MITMKKIGKHVEERIKKNLFLSNKYLLIIFSINNYASLLRIIKKIVRNYSIRFLNYFNQYLF